METTNFRVIYHESREQAEEAARIAETTRSTVLRKWFGEEPTPWKVKCLIFLFPTAKYYAHMTGRSMNSPGHSTLQFAEDDLERVLSRRIDLHCDVAKMLTHGLPHETTHTVVAGRFGPHLVPLWADEGMAMLSEPRPRVQQCLKKAMLLRSKQELFPVSKLMTLTDYPKPHRLTAFYVQSVSLVEFLCTRKGGTRTFVRFLRDGLETGYEAALRRHYNIKDCKELEAIWLQTIAEKDGGKRHDPIAAPAASSRGPEHQASGQTEKLNRFSREER